MDNVLPTIAVLGASGLIGSALCDHLSREGFPTIAIARRFTKGQKARLGGNAVELQIADIETSAISDLLSERRVDIVVNCIGILQDTPGGKTDTVHSGFVGRLVQALETHERQILLVHISIPGQAEEDRTAFSQTKRVADRLVTDSRIPYVILRPGFVIGSGAYGGSALVRSLATLPFGLPAKLAHLPFAATGIADIGQTIAVVARRWTAGEKQWAFVWDVMEREPSTANDVVDAFRKHFGGPGAIVSLPFWLMVIGAKFGDFLAYFGWLASTRTTALSEMQRGVSGDAEQWSAATGIAPMSLEQALQSVPATVQEAWFARLYLVKALTIVSLSVFWVLSGTIALTVAFDAAAAILTSHGVSLLLAQIFTWTTGLADIAIGMAIAFRKTCRIGLISGIGLSLFYLTGAGLFASALWVDPLGPLVKTVPVIVLMLVALAILKARGG